MQIDSSIRFVDEELKILERVMKAKGAHDVQQPFHAKKVVLTRDCWRLPGIDFGDSAVVEHKAPGGRKRKNSAIHT